VELGLYLAERFMDVTDVVLRRQRARRIYRELARERISRRQAADELRNLSKRQKGGWLRAKLRRAEHAPAAPEEPAAPRADHSPGPGRSDRERAQEVAPHASDRRVAEQLEFDDHGT
jgi:hypothetical protein